MRLRSLVWNELRERPWSVLSSSISILLGVAALVAIRHLTVHSEKEVSRQLTSLGANVLILPRDTTLQNYYAADRSGRTLPEEHVFEVLMAGLPGIEKVTPKLGLPARLKDTDVILTGILPQSEFTAQSAWQTASLFQPKKHEGCRKASHSPSPADNTPETLNTTRSIESLEPTQIVLGADIADRTTFKTGDTVELLGGTFTVIGALSRSGTVDDSRIFAHLHTVQKLAEAGEVVSAIEVIGCCEDAAGDLVPELSRLLPDARVVTVSQVVETQVGVNRLMSGTSWLVSGILVIVGGASLASAIAANVRERKREIGTLMAIGATPGFVLRMFLLKALVLGLTAGTIGCLLGLVTAVTAGPQWVGVSVSPIPSLSILAVCAATGLAVVAAFWPARQAAAMDPCLSFQDI
jgi:putative ABC transport system permease protein